MYCCFSIFVFCFSFGNSFILVVVSLSLIPIIDLRHENTNVHLAHHKWRSVEFRIAVAAFGTAFCQRWHTFSMVSDRLGGHSASFICLKTIAEKYDNFGILYRG